MNEKKHNYTHRYFAKAIELLKQYNGKEPLHFYLKKYFSDNKQHGSKDRKFISHFCYTFFRIGNNLNAEAIEEKLKIALFICEDSIESLKEIFDLNWFKNHSPNINERISFIQSFHRGFSLQNVFPFSEELSETIDFTAFSKSFFLQPKVFLRIRNNKKKLVLDKIIKANVPFEIVEESAIAVPQNTPLENILQLNNEVVIQDLSSQKIGSFLESISLKNQTKSSFLIWDCCAASGGKSILAKDVFVNAELTVSDIRPQIIHNLKQRFREAKIQTYKSFIADLSKPVTLKEKFDLIICDAPCSGSGTWSRTPEMLLNFDKMEAVEYQLLQRKIVSNTIPHLKESGYFLYITCSVFKKENEDMAAFISENFSLSCLRSGLIKGYTHQADSMFAALFAAKK
ncbi:MAG: Fmu (Sun) domain-containing protein [Arachidicoccus sp.]|nr:Fmu (Sun) domain-containing protein [Arachidicoccus sp.]